MTPATLARGAFLAAAATMVWTFVRTAQRDHVDVGCRPLCAMAPAYANRNRTLPDFELPDLSGKRVSMSSLRGKPMVLNFWTQNCRPCLEEMPSLAELAAHAQRTGAFHVVTISTDETPAVASQALRQSLGTTSPPFSVLLDPEAQIVGGVFGTTLYPETWIIDAEGVIRVRVDGARDWSHAMSLELIERQTSAQACPVEFLASRPVGPQAALCTGEL